jgi:multiple sugar transport system substrate-binding protein
VITFAAFSWQLGEYDIEKYETILEEFHQQHPEITVQLREQPLTVDARQIASAADTTLVIYQPSGQSDYFLDLNPLMDGDAAFDRDDFWPGSLQACEDDQGRVYGLPLTVELSGIYYREEAFDAAGLPYPQPGWTWEDFRQVMNSLAGQKDGEPVYGFADDSFLTFVDESLLSPRIGALLDETGGAIDAERLAGELQWYVAAVKADSLFPGNIYPQRYDSGAGGGSETWSKAWNEAWKEWQAMFKQRPPAMWKGKLNQDDWAAVNMAARPDGSISMSGSGAQMMKKTGIGWAPYPVSDAGQVGTTPALVTCAVISKGASQVRAAWTWLKFLSEHPVTPEWDYSVPARASLGAQSGWWSKIPEKFHPAVQYSLEHAWYGSPYPAAVTAANEALFRSLKEGTDLQIALEEADQQAAEAPPPGLDEEPISVAPPDPVQPAADIAIDFYPFIYGGERAGMESLAADFNRLHPGIAVTIGSSSANGLAELVESQDCFAWYAGDTAAGLVQDLTPFLEADSTGLRNDFSPGLLEEFTRDGKLTGLPLGIRPNLLYYNADLLAQRGLKPPANDWTFDDFLALISAAASTDENNPSYGLALDYNLWPVDMFLAGRNLRLADLNADPPHLTFDSPESQAFLEWLVELAGANVLYSASSIDVESYNENFTAARQAILDGKVAFWLSWYADDSGGTFQIQDPGFNLGVAPLPGAGNGWNPRHVSLGLFISPNAENPQACWEWMKFLTENTAGDYGVPARRSVQESENWKNRVGPENSATYLASLEGRRLLNQANLFSLGPARDWWLQILGEAMNGGDPIRLLAELQDKADQFTACLAGSADYQIGESIQKDQAEQACLKQVDAEGNQP